MKNKEALIVKLEAAQAILPPIIEQLRGGKPVPQEEIVKTLQIVGGEVFDILVSDFQVFHIGREGDKRVVSEWAYRADREEAEAIARKR